MKKLYILVLLGIVFFNLQCAGSGQRRKNAEHKESVKREILYGQLLAKEILKRYPLVKNKAIHTYVSMVGKSVALFSGRSDIVYHFAVLDSDSINAYATPGGYIFITRGALMQMKNESELAAVLAHEIGHVNFKHIMKELPPPRETKGFVDRIAAILLARGTMVTSAFNAVVSKAAKLLFEKGYKIAAEYEADKAALFYTYETGYHPGGLVEFLKRISKAEQKMSKKLVYNTHPDTTERISRLETLITKNKLNLNKPKVIKRFNSQLKPLLSYFYELAIEVDYGKALATLLIKKFGTVKNNDIFTYINKVGKSVALFAGRSDLVYTFEILNTQKIGVFSTPGGYIFITKGALKFIKNEAELAAVFAKEIAHINLKYLTKKISPPLVNNIDNKNYPDMIISASKKAYSFLITDNFSDSLQQRSDKHALHYYYEIGYSHSGLLSFLKRLVKIPRNKVYSYNYSDANDRISSLSSVIKKEQMKEKKPINIKRYIKAIKGL